MAVGDAFLDFFDRGATHHLWFVLTEEIEGEFAIANVTSVGPHILDRSCVLRLGDHPFVEHESIVLYQKARLITPVTFRGWTMRGLVEARDPASAELMDRVREGALDSPFTPRDVKHAVRGCFWCPPRHW